MYANRAALAQLGFETLEEAQRRPLVSIMDEYAVHDQDGRPITIDDIPSVKLLRGQPAEPLLIHTVNRRTGQARWELLKATGLHDGDGRLTAAVTVIEDLTAVKTAEVHMRMLAESGRILASSLDYQQTLQNVAQIAVPGLADWCVVDLVDANLQRDQVAIAHCDPAQHELVARMRELEPSQLDPDSTLGRVFRTQTSELFFELSDQDLIAGARGQEHLELLRQLGICSALVVPMRVPARTIGVMTFLTSESRRRLTDEDLELAEQLARRAAVAVENSRLHTTLARVSETLQQSLRPGEPPKVPGWEIAAHYQPAGAAQRIEVGGDFYEVFAAGGAFLALVGDVAGHGVTAAALTGLMRHGAQFASRLEPRPAAILAWLDDALRRRAGTELCTAVCARLDVGRLALSSAGHPPALLVDGRGQVTEAPAPGPLLGAFDDARWSEQTVPVPAGTLVLLYTDGVTETEGGEERFGLERLRQLLVDHAGATPAELLEGLRAALDRFRAGPARDDVAALALRPAAGRG